ncbi:MAG: YebC/PmpR family DNA-binding transcriptional regulator [Ignavibacteria bacterium CG_4_8_14_3_um_filter_37_9]|nr:YebC/PmpR family DNA-binding transcriptional regulator [Ignavibacteria bacterium]OIO21862.1 MAG: transcriptional regulator [Ignavibacteria bacterium CG1_02_37_35]PIP76177.1 MAG: YebC/PmpR family DNA-binding transcriptional regulator [Ignavibacteria bacterium CG22_combo_CG10-13_8_21_14_all_37_15]PIS45740.1 MAG: YebC/PmpR family DNA-binding transcriptional regulator [Ignavibacteria bacterium CG08_land_8_20_14_0_20_37_9]PIW97923.1 MAG: YebC/PmpR family DNA-binding transcriptional regulator [Ign
MSGHSKWATIKRKKGATDAKRGKIFTKLIKEITIAARQGGGDPNGNPRLRLAIDNAKAANMPADNIERAIKKATGELEGVSFTELMYEGYGPGGIAILVEVATDNKNRTVAEVRHIFSKIGGSMGESGSVAWMFERKGIISVKRNNKTEDEVMEIVLEAGADDMETETDYFEVTTTLESFEPVRKTLLEKSLEIENAALEWIAKNTLAVAGEDAEKVVKLIETLEDNDDVQNVFSNADIQE